MPVKLHQFGIFFLHVKMFINSSGFFYSDLGRCSCPVSRGLLSVYIFEPSKKTLRRKKIQSKIATGDCLPFEFPFLASLFTSALAAWPSMRGFSAAPFVFCRFKSSMMAFRYWNQERTAIRESYSSFCVKSQIITDRNEIYLFLKWQTRTFAK